MFGTCSATASAVHDDNHRRPWTKPSPYLDESSSHYGHKGPELHRSSVWNRPPPNTRVTTLPPFVTCSGHPSKYWPRSLQLNWDTLPHHQKACSLARQYKFPLILSATITLTLSMNISYRVRHYIGIVNEYIISCMVKVIALQMKISIHKLATSISLYGRCYLIQLVCFFLLFWILKDKIIVHVL
jgi:hypothetical protein